MQSVFIAACISLYLINSISADAVVYTSGNYKLTITNNDPNFLQETRQRCIDTYFATMPLMCNRFNHNSCPREVSLIIDHTYDGVAYAFGTTVVVSADWFRDNPHDTDVLTHECMHIVQSYPTADPGWLVEGIADYSRWKYGQNNEAGGWSLPDFDAGHHYADAYGITARFLVWCENRYSTIVNKLNTALQANTYRPNIWVQITGGKSIDQLWSEYSSNPAIEKPSTPTGD